MVIFEADDTEKDSTPLVSRSVRSSTSSDGSSVQNRFHFTRRAKDPPAKVLLTLWLPLTALHIVPVSSSLHRAPGSKKTCRTYSQTAMHYSL